MGNIKEPLKLGAILGIIALVIAVMLAFVNNITADKIEAVNEQIVQEGLKEVMPSDTKLEFILMEGADLENELGVTINNMYLAIDANDKSEDVNILGYCATAQPEGYGGSVEVIVGMNLEGDITGVKVTSNMSETAGLGAKAQESEFTNQYKGKKAPFSLSKDGGEIDAITSATITSKAVTDGVNAAVEVMSKNGSHAEYGVTKDELIDGKYIVKAEKQEEKPEEKPETEVTPEGEAEGGEAVENTEDALEPVTEEETTEASGETEEAENE